MANFFDLPLPIARSTILMENVKLNRLLSKISVRRTKVLVKVPNIRSTVFNRLTLNQRLRKGFDLVVQLHLYQQQNVDKVKFKL